MHAVYHDYFSGAATAVGPVAYVCVCVSHL